MPPFAPPVAPVRGRSSREPSPHSSSGCWCPANRNLPWTSQIMTPAPLGTQTQSSNTPQHGAARAHRRRRARAYRSHWASAIRSDRADDRPGAGAPSVWPGARADSTSDGGYSVEIAGAMESPTHGATAGDEHKLDLGDLTDFHSDIPSFQPSPEL